jgi:8-oxo-dGTP pyrophosphatase MutT (NUDIX family)
LLRAADDSPDAIKSRVVNAWVRGIKPSARRKFRPMAEQIYDKITAIPKQSDILQSKMPFREKCALIEQMEMLGQTHPGTADYFAIKKDIFRIMSSYEKITDNADDLEQIDINADKLQADANRDVPLRMKILKSDLSDHNKKVLLIRHKMLGIWLAPGGHVEENELPHQAAEREFFEETGLKVEVISAQKVLPSDAESENLPLPFTSNLHWINKPGEKPKPRSSGEVCEQHYGFAYFVKPIAPLSDIGKSSDPDEGIEEVHWFTEKELKTLKTRKSIKSEIRFALAHYPKK